MIFQDTSTHLQLFTLEPAQFKMVVEGNWTQKTKMATIESIL